MKYVMMAMSSNFGNMFSMAGGVLFLPFQPMLPVQILLNNLLYDLSETAIPPDRVGAAMVAQPRRWDLETVRKFMFVFGPLSSAFDYAPFGLLLWAFQANEALFQTGWFVELMASQILIFLLRSTDPLRDRPHPALVASTLGACHNSLFALCTLARVRSAPRRGPGHAGSRHRRISGLRSNRQTLVLRASSDCLTALRRARI